MSTPRTYFLIRHANAVDAPAFNGPRNERPLTEQGQEQAKALAGKLSGLGIAAVYSSPATRCQQTAAHVADKAGVEVIVKNGYLEGRSINLPEDHEVCAVVAHGDNIPALLDELGIQAHACQTASAWKVEVDSSGQTSSSEYIV